MAADERAVETTAQPVPSSTDLEPPLTECPAWCQLSARTHGWSGLDYEDRPCREHTVDFGTVVATTDTDSPKPEAWVSIDQLESWTPQGSTYDQPAVVLAVEFWPRFTADEARRVAVELVTAADRLDAILGSR